MADVNEDSQDPDTSEQPEGKKRGRPKGSGKTQTAQPAKTSLVKKTKASDAMQTKIMVQTLLNVGFTITAARAGDHWKLTNDEAEALADPIAAIMDRHNLSEKAGAYGEYIALVAAIGMIIVPRVMTSIDQKKSKGGLRLVQKSDQPNQRQQQQASATGSGENGNAAANDRINSVSEQPSTTAPTTGAIAALSWLGG